MFVIIRYKDLADCYRFYVCRRKLQQSAAGMAQRLASTLGVVAVGEAFAPSAAAQRRRCDREI